MEIKSSSEKTRYNSTMLSTEGIFLGNQFSINPYSGISYPTAPSQTAYSKGLTKYGKYLINCDIVYSGSAGNILHNFFLQMIPIEDNSTKIEYSKTNVSAYSATVKYIYLVDNTIRFVYREFDSSVQLDYAYWEFNLDTFIWTKYNTDSASTEGTLLGTTGPDIPGYSTTATMSYTGGSGSYTHTPGITFNAI